MQNPGWLGIRNVLLTGSRQLPLDQQYHWFKSLDRLEAHRTTWQDRKTTRRQSVGYSMEPVLHVHNADWFVWLEVKHQFLWISRLRDTSPHSCKSLSSLREAGLISVALSIIQSVQEAERLVTDPALILPHQQQRTNRNIKVEAPPTAAFLFRGILEVPVGQIERTRWPVRLATTSWQRQTESAATKHCMTASL